MIGIPWWLRGESVCPQCGRPGFDSWVRKIPWKRKWQPTPVFSPGESHGWRSLMGYSPRGRRVGHDWATSPHLHVYFLILVLNHICFLLVWVFFCNTMGIVFLREHLFVIVLGNRETIELEHFNFLWEDQLNVGFSSSTLIVASSPRQSSYHSSNIGLCL